CAAVPLLRTLLQTDLPHRDDRNLRHGEYAVGDDQDEKKEELDCYQRGIQGLRRGVHRSELEVGIGPCGGICRQRTVVATECYDASITHPARSDRPPSTPMRTSCGG